MGFLKKNKAPGELPDLVVGDSKLKENNEYKLKENNEQINEVKKDEEFISIPKIPEEPKPILETDSKREYFEFKDIPNKEIEKKEIKKEIEDNFKSNIDENSFFDKILEDINGEITDLGKIEEWYENKFLPQDVISNMRTYWEDNKAEMIIKSFGSEYRKRINDKIKKLQGLEGDWREIYFKLVKKEEEMKKEERELKETLSEFVELCKRRKAGGEKEEE